MERAIKLWQKSVMVFGAVGLPASVFYYCTRTGPEPADLSIAALILIAFLWTGVFLGAALEWARYGISPLEPLMRNRDMWFYRQRFWLRFAILFAFAWACFVLIAAGSAVAIGEVDEAGILFSPRGALLLFIFLLVFAAEGAVVGGIIDVFRIISGKKAGE
ncbi:MAG: hypothetical protein ABSG42_07130 [Nitrospirota bacterium]